MADSGMIIDELPALPGAAEMGDEIPIEREQNTYKVTTEGLANALIQKSVLPIFCGTIDELPKTINDVRISNDMVAIGYYASDVTALPATGGWTIDTGTGSLAITGTLLNTTELVLYLAREQEAE